MKSRITIAAILLCCLSAVTARSDSDRLKESVLSLVEGAPNHYLNDPDALSRYLQEVRETESESGVPASLLLAVQYLESSLKPDRIGKRGEIGIMQVHPSMTGGCEMATRRGQMACGAAILAAAYEHCGTWEGALTRYAQRSGRCRPDTDRVKRVIDYRVRFWEGLK